MGDRVAGICTRCGVLKTFGPGSPIPARQWVCLPCRAENRSIARAQRKAAHRANACRAQRASIAAGPV
jgi:hypothetical protein